MDEYLALGSDNDRAHWSRSSLYVICDAWMGQRASGQSYFRAYLLPAKYQQRWQTQWKKMEKERNSKVNLSIPHLKIQMFIAWSRRQYQKNGNKTERATAGLTRALTELSPLYGTRSTMGRGRTREQWMGNRHQKFSRYPRSMARSTIKSQLA